MGSDSSVLQLTIKLQPKQRQLERAISAVGDVPTIIGFGGSRGAAKSGGIRRISLKLAVGAPRIIIWIVRRVWDDLNKDHVKPLFLEYPELQQFWRAMDRELQLPNGSSIFFVHSGDSGEASARRAALKRITSSSSKLRSSPRKRSSSMTDRTARPARRRASARRF